MLPNDIFWRVITSRIVLQLEGRPLELRSLSTRLRLSEFRYKAIESETVCFSQQHTPNKLRRMFSYAPTILVKFIPITCIASRYFSRAFSSKSRKIRINAGSWLICKVFLAVLALWADLKERKRND